MPQAKSTKKIGCLGWFALAGAVAVLIGIIAAAVLIGIIGNVFQRQHAAKAPSAQEAAEAEQKQHASRTPLEVAKDETKLVRFSWRKEGFDNVMLANFTFRNNSPYDVKDLDIECEHSAPSGTVIDKNERTIYQIVKAHSTRTIRDINMGLIDTQAAASSCEVLDLSLVPEP